MNNWRYNLRYIFTFIAQCNFPATSFVCHCIPLLPNVVVLKIFRFSRCLYAYRNDYITTECNLSFIALKKKITIGSFEIPWFLNMRINLLSVIPSSNLLTVEEMLSMNIFSSTLAIKIILKKYISTLQKLFTQFVRQNWSDIIKMNISLKIKIELFISWKECMRKIHVTFVPFKKNKL